MRPYIAIIKDSFHEARASKVFWILIAFSSLILLALLPFGFDETSKVFSYARYDFPTGLTAGGKDAFLQGVISWLIVWGLGFFVLFTAILVTSNFIPNTFKEGSVDLLLSKPVSRPALFLSRFFGGCCFYFVNVGYLIGGIFVILGLRVGYWEPKLFTCLLLSLFLFMIYYSVSAIAGLLWRNTIVCIMMTIGFWGLCKGVEHSKNIFDALAIDPIVKIIKTDDHLLSRARP